MKGRSREESKQRAKNNAKCRQTASLIYQCKNETTRCLLDGYQQRKNDYLYSVYHISTPFTLSSRLQSLSAVRSISFEATFVPLAFGFPGARAFSGSVLRGLTLQDQHRQSITSRRRIQDSSQVSYSLLISAHSRLLDFLIVVIWISLRIIISKGLSLTLLCLRAAGR